MSTPDWKVPIRLSGPWIFASTRRSPRVSSSAGPLRAAKDSLCPGEQGLLQRFSPCRESAEHVSVAELDVPESDRHVNKKVPTAFEGFPWLSATVRPTTAKKIDTSEDAYALLRSRTEQPTNEWRGDQRLRPHHPPREHHLNTCSSTTFVRRTGSPRPASGLRGGGLTLAVGGERIRGYTL